MWWFFFTGCVFSNALWIWALHLGWLEWRGPPDER